MLSEGVFAPLTFLRKTCLMNDIDSETLPNEVGEYSVFLETLVSTQC